MAYGRMYNLGEHRIIDGLRAIAHILFFFSSRRRHTRCSRDWSSDVCSSDLTPPPMRTSLPSAASFACRRASAGVASRKWKVVSASVNDGRSWCVKIGRASCREGELILVDGVRTDVQSRRAQDHRRVAGHRAHPFFFFKQKTAYEM